MELKGQCLCGAVQYRVTQEPISSFYCHCVDCRRSGGSLFHHGLAVARQGFSHTGDMTVFASKTDAGRRIKRNFCTQCGSGMFNELEHRPDHIMLKAGTLNELPADLAPTKEVWARSKAPWLDTGDLMESHAAGSPPK